MSSARPRRSWNPLDRPPSVTFRLGSSVRAIQKATQLPRASSSSARQASKRSAFVLSPAHLVLRRCRCSSLPCFSIDPSSLLPTLFNLSPLPFSFLFLPPFFFSFPPFFPFLFFFC